MRMRTCLLRCPFVIRPCLNECAGAMGDEMEAAISEAQQEPQQAAQDALYTLTVACLILVAIIVVHLCINAAVQ